MRAFVSAILIAIPVAVLAGCGTRPEAARSTPPASLGLAQVTHGLRPYVRPLANTRRLSFEEAVALRDDLNEAMIDTMLEYMSDCDLMADKMEEYLPARQADYEAVAGALVEIPWSAQELAPDRLRRRLQKADDTIRKMTPASEACRMNAKAMAVMREHFYGE